MIRWLSYGCQSTTSFEYFWQKTLGCTIISNSDYPFTTSIEYVSGTDSYASSRTFSGSGGINAYSIQIRFQQSDLTTTTSSPVTATATPGTTASTVAAPSSTSTQNDNQNSNASGLSIGAAAGIGVGCGVAGVLAIVAGMLYCKRRGKKRRVAAGAGVDLTRPDKPELSEGKNDMSPVEAPSWAGLHGRTGPQELDSRGLPVEMGHGENHPYELP